MTRLRWEARRDGAVSPEPGEEKPARGVVKKTSTSLCQVYADAAQANLRRHVIDKWLPGAVDRERGGFHENFAEDWSPVPNHRRSLVFQSRLTWLAAVASGYYPEKRETFHECATHGLNFLTNRFQDKDNGGLYWSLDATGKPEQRGAKHAYAISFAIYAGATFYLVTREKAGLELAQTCFTWLEEHAHDDAHGGYFESLTRLGHPIHSPWGLAGRDALGVPHGLKSLNTHLHLMEAFTALYRSWPDAALRTRLGEVSGLIGERIVAAPGNYCELFFTPEWRPLSHHVSFGHDVETAYLLAEAAAALGTPEDEATWKQARRLVDHALECGWDNEHGGFYDEVSLFEKGAATDKVWWVQAEGLNALLMLHMRYRDETSQYWQVFASQWEFINRHQIDEQYGGWLKAVRPDGAAISGLPKGNEWTEGYHQARALINVTGMLRQLAAVD